METEKHREQKQEIPQARENIDSEHGIHLVQIVSVQVTGIVDVAKHEPQEMILSTRILVVLIVVVIWKDGRRAR